MKFNWFVGVDVSKNTLDITLLENNKKILFKQIENDVKSLCVFVKDIKALNINLSECLFCVEHTGVYCNPLLDISEKMSLNLWLENATQIKLSIGLQRGKNDKIDSERIAEYAYRFQDKVNLRQPERGAVKALRALNLARTRLVQSLKELQTVSKEQDHYSAQAKFGGHFKNSIRAMKSDLERIEEEISRVINDDDRLKELFKIVKSVTGVGSVIALNMILTTNEFKDFTNPKKYACYAGVVPFDHTSGISINGRKRVSRKANMQMKSLLHMGALGAIRSNKEVREFYERKIAEGKAKMNVINAIRNKLIHRIFACVRENREYENIYDKALA